MASVWHARVSWDLQELCMDPIGSHTRCMCSDTVRIFLQGRVESNTVTGTLAGTLKAAQHRDGSEESANGKRQHESKWGCPPPIATARARIVLPDQRKINRGAKAKHHDAGYGGRLDGITFHFHPRGPSNSEDNDGYPAQKDVD